MQSTGYRWETPGTLARRLGQALGTSLETVYRWCRAEAVVIRRLPRGRFLVLVDPLGLPVLDGEAPDELPKVTG